MSYLSHSLAKMESATPLHWELSICSLFTYVIVCSKLSSRPLGNSFPLF